MTAESTTMQILTVERGGKRISVQLGEIQNGDTIVGGVLAPTFDEPVAVLPWITELTLRDCNLAQVLLDEPVELVAVDGTVKMYPAAPHTTGWRTEGGLHHCYKLRSVEERDEARAAALDELERAFEVFERYFPKLKAAAKEKPAVLTRLRTKFRRLIGRAEAAQLLGCNIPAAGVQGTWADTVIDGGG